MTYEICGTDITTFDGWQAFAEGYSELVELAARDPRSNISLESDIDDSVGNFIQVQPDHALAFLRRCTGDASVPTPVRRLAGRAALADLIGDQKIDADGACEVIAAALKLPDTAQDSIASHTLETIAQLRTNSPIGMQRLGRIIAAYREGRRRPNTS